MLDDDSARQALRTLTDEPAPPVTTTVDQVLRRGKRRVFAQRMGAAAGVMAVVVAIGVSAAMLRGGDNLQVGDSTTAPAPPSSVPSSAATDRSFERLPAGWAEVPLPEGTIRSGEYCQDPNVPELPPEPDRGLLPEGEVKQAYTNAIDHVTGDKSTTVTSDWLGNSPKHNAPRGYVVVEVAVGGGVSGNGQVQLEVGRYGGRPDQIAAASVTVYGNCTGPARHIGADGTIYQLYQLDTSSPEQPMQHLQIYRPDNRFYTITAAGYGEADMKYESDGTGTVVGGRGKLPVTQEELMEIGTKLVENLD